MSPSVFAAATHVGQLRANNEDAWGSGDELWVVADGMGGHAGGEVASRIAVQTVLEAAPTGADELREAFLGAHHAVLDAASGELSGMGTTLVVAARTADRTVLVGSVGDSRAYLLGTDGALRRITVDDNEAEVLLADGVITAEQARTHPGQYLLTASVGALSRATAPQVYTLAPRAGRLLLCSDGLNGELDDDAILKLLTAGTPDDVSARLVTAAVQAGGRDNVTVLVVDL